MSICAKLDENAFPASSVATLDGQPVTVIRKHSPYTRLVRRDNGEELYCPISLLS